MVTSHSTTRTTTSEAVVGGWEDIVTFCKITEIAVRAQRKRERKEGQKYRARLTTRRASVP